MELGDEPVGLHQLAQGEGGVVDTHLGLGGVHGGVGDLLHHVGTKRRVADLLSGQLKHQEKRSQPQKRENLYQESEIPQLSEISTL